MPESRNRLSRLEDMTAMFARRWQMIGHIEILQDKLEGTTAMTSTCGVVGVGATRGGGVGRGALGMPRARNGHGYNLYGTLVMGRENRPTGSFPWGRGRSQNSVLPSWYPRMPLRDITAVVRVMVHSHSRLLSVSEI
ncbi:hypothetical protein NMG60_11033749 [Bertholletia excelsa]